MILVDTSVWIDHLRAGDRDLIRLLEDRQVLGHPFVLGELALGHLRQREPAMATCEHGWVDCVGGVSWPKEPTSQVKGAPPSPSAAHILRESDGLYFASGACYNACGWFVERASSAIALRYTRAKVFCSPSHQLGRTVGLFPSRSGK